MPVLTDAGEIASPFGQLVVAAGSIADFGAIILLSIFFTGKGGVGSTLLLLGLIFALAVAVYFALRGAERSKAITSDLVRLQDTTAQIRVRGAVVLMIGFVALAEAFGLEVILGASRPAPAGAGGQGRVHDLSRTAPQARGGGLRRVHPGLLRHQRHPLRPRRPDRRPGEPGEVPLFLAALLVARGLPAALYRGFVGTRRAVVGGLLQATSLPFIVTATAIGVELDLMGGSRQRR